MEFKRQIIGGKLQKAYLISLCLCAKRALADTTEEGTAEQEKAFVDQVLESLTQPSAEHMNTYIGLGLALAIIAGIVFMAIGGGQTDKNQIKVTMDDVKTESKPDPNQAKKLAKKQKKKAEAEVKPKEDEDWSDDDDPADNDAIYKAIDQGGPFVRTDSGTLEPESMLALRKIIIKHAAYAFMTRKEELFQARLGLLKQARWQEYSECLRATQDEFAHHIFEQTKTAAEFIDLDPATYEASVRDC